MAEREGFEPSVQLSPHTRLAGERLQPTRPSLRNDLLCFILWVFLTGVAPGISFNPGGGSRIRTHGAFAQRFSRPPPSTTRPSLLHEIHFILFFPKRVNRFLADPIYFSFICFTIWPSSGKISFSQASLHAFWLPGMQKIAVLPMMPAVERDIRAAEPISS